MNYALERAIVELQLARLDYHHAHTLASMLRQLDASCPEQALYEADYRSERCRLLCDLAEVAVREAGGVP